MSDDPHTPRPNGGVFVPSDRVYDLVLTLKDDMANLRGDIREIKGDVEAIVKEQHQLAIRTRALELKVYGLLAGFIAALGVLLKIGGAI